MDRRQFIKDGLLTAASALVANPLGKLFQNAIRIPGDEDSPSAVAQSRDVYNSEEQAEITASMLKEKFDIPTEELATKLHDRMSKEIGLYGSGGALAASSCRALSNSCDPEGREKLSRKFINVLGGTGAAFLGSYPAKGVVGLVQESPLTKPETLINEYGLSQVNADRFCDHYKKVITGITNASGAAVNTLQEMLFPAKKYEEGPEDEGLDEQADKAPEPEAT